VSISPSLSRLRLTTTKTSATTINATQHKITPTKINIHELDAVGVDDVDGTLTTTFGNVLLIVDEEDETWETNVVKLETVEKPDVNNTCGGNVFTSITGVSDDFVDVTVVVVVLFEVDSVVVVVDGGVVVVGVIEVSVFVVNTHISH